jgi:hypothetical protein
MNSPSTVTVVVNSNSKRNWRSGQDQDWFKDMERAWKIKLSEFIVADIFFPKCSLGINIFIFWDETTEENLCTDYQNMIERAKESQKTFRNSLAICVGLDETQFDSVQGSMPFGSMRFVHCCGLREIYPIIKKYFELISDTQKGMLQDEYFEDTKAVLLQSCTAKFVAESFLVEDLGIDSNEARLLMEGYPTIRQLLSASKGHLEETSPVDMDTINKLTTFAHPPNPSSSPSLSSSHCQGIGVNTGHTYTQTSTDISSSNEPRREVGSIQHDYKMPVNTQRKPQRASTLKDASVAANSASATFANTDALTSRGAGNKGVEVGSYVSRNFTGASDERFFNF